MLGVKIFFTGLLLMALAVLFVPKGNSYPGHVVAITFILAFWGGMAALFAGALIGIWL